MIQIGTYTKEEMAAALNIKCGKASHITDKLRKLNYRFSTSGRGSTYRINIIGLPQATLKEFAEKYLGIAARFEDRLAQFLCLLLTSGKEEYVNYSYRSLEWVSQSSYNTIEGWMKSLIECGLLIEEPLVNVYYATQKEIVEEYDNGDYDYTQKIKEITKEEYDLAIKAYSDTMKGFGEISKNPDIAYDEAVYLANSARREALNGWWAMRKKDNDRLHINYQWKELPQLLSLLEKNNVVWEYKRLKRGNHEKDWDLMEERFEKWEEEKRKKREKLMETEIIENLITPNIEVEVEVEDRVIKDNTPPAKIRSNREIERCKDFHEYLLQLNELFYKTKKGFYEYEEE